MFTKYFKFTVSGLLIIVFSFLFFLSPGQAGTKNDLYNQMDSAGNKAWGEVPTAGSTGLPDIIRYAVSAFLGLLGIIFIVLIIYAGFSLMTAGGDEEKVSLAKNTLTRAVIGLIIIVAAYSITYFVFSSLPGGESGVVDGNP
ncbi:MAG: pilin [Patescibacteria group bacterium]|nr:pilin [Patescibacteria group bacterium]